jgi:hypothetical protein
MKGRLAGWLGFYKILKYLGYNVDFVLPTPRPSQEGTTYFLVMISVNKRYKTIDL